jgi:ATP-dependent Clp protease ATP-binding subunit ClpA
VVSPEAIQTAVSASGRFLRHRALPDRPIYLIDEAGARVKLRGKALPPELPGFKDGSAPSRGRWRLRL